MISVKQLWVRFPKGFTKYNEFYASLGSNIPKYCDLDGGVGIQKEYCVDRHIDVKSIVGKFGITDYSEQLFNTPIETFNNQHKISYNYKLEKDQEPYILVKDYPSAFN